MSRHFNEYEKAFIESIRTAETYISGDEELEIDFIIDEEDENKDGWYAYRYNEALGSAFPIEANGYDEKPLISVNTAESHNVDVDKCIKYCKVYYVS